MESQDYREKLISQLTLENRKLKEELTALHYQKYQLESDFEYLKQTLEEQLPFFNELEQQNMVLKEDLNKKDKHMKNIGNSS
mmetsp:Transcript_39172/g.37546  ORF Transcript_39172/g.37546 Transcript_39172/m.37546 type:complete len:82 (+) Transcript_39172:551-796(+)